MALLKWFKNIFIVVVSIMTVASASGQTSAQPLPAGTELSADSLEFLQDKNLLIATGNVEIQQGEDTLNADYLTVKTDTQDVYARGHIVFKREGKVWQGEELRYNLKTKQGDFGEFTAFVDPYYITAEDSKRISTNEFLLTDVSLTTCDGDYPEFYIRAREARLINGDQLQAKSVVVYLGGVPVFYVPRMNRSLRSHDRYFEFLPGYSSRHGAFLLSAYNYRMTDSLKGRTRLDYRSKRGWAGGQDFIWEAPDDRWKGEVNGYYANDEEPFEDAEEEAEEADLVDSERYRLKLSHFHTLTERDYVIADVNYLSDPDVVEDFFDQEFRLNSQPENRVTLTHRGDKYTAALLVNKRLNDFYDNVDRVPEASLDLQRQQISDSPFFYESQNSAAQLEKVFSEDSDDEDYDAFRIDSGHTIFYPTRHFGFLNLTPRAGYRGTFYSDTLSTSTITNTLIVTDTNGISSVTNEIENVINQEGGDLRNVYELGFETSFKAFRTWNDVIVLDADDGFRHVAEPFAKYTYVPRPNLRPEDLPQFDDVDELDKRHDVQLGVRNKFQTKRHGRVHDLADINIFTYYRIEHEEDEEDFSEIFFDTELRIVDWLPVDFDGSYDQYGSEISKFNTQISYLMEDQSSLSLEYRYERDDNDLVATELVLFPNNKWSFTAYGRYDFVEGDLQEQSYFIQRKTSCMGYGLGFKQVDDDNQVWLQLWLLAFPGTNLQLGQ